MGKKKQPKKRKKRKFAEEMRQHPVNKEIQAFLEKRRVAMNKAGGLTYIVSMMVGFLVCRSIKNLTQLPVISPEEEEADKDRMQRLGRILGYECHQLGIEFQEIMEELVLPAAGNKALIEPVFNEIYGMLDSLILSDSFRETTESQIENPEFWGDSLMHYEEHKEDYLEAVKKLSALVLDVARSGHDEELEDMNHEKALEEIRKTHGIQPDDFQKLRRRATEFFRIAFAKYLSMVFQPVRDEVDKRTSDATSNSSRWQDGKNSS